MYTAHVSSPLEELFNIHFDSRNDDNESSSFDDNRRCMSSIPIETDDEP